MELKEAERIKKNLNKQVSIVDKKLQLREPNDLKQCLLSELIAYSLALSGRKIPDVIKGSLLETHHENSDFLLRYIGKYNSGTTRETNWAFANTLLSAFWRGESEDKLGPILFHNNTDQLAREIYSKNRNSDEFEKQLNTLLGVASIEDIERL